MTIDYDYILNLIAQELNDALDSESNTKIFITDEQSFIKEKDKNPEGIYVVVRFNRASTVLNQSVLPVILTIMGFENEVENTQSLFNKFISENNMKVENDITQIWMSPEVILNFNNVWTGYRSLFTISGTFVIGNGTVRINKITYKYTSDEEVKTEDIAVIGFMDITEASINTQPYSNTKGRTRSHGSFITNAFSIVIYPVGNLEFVQKLMEWKYDFSSNHEDDDWLLSGEFINSRTNMPESVWKCRSANFSQKIGDLPTMEVVFTR